MSVKTSYHPLYTLFYKQGRLSKNEVKKIPYTTRKYWDNLNQEHLFGYTIIKEYANNLNNIGDIEEKKALNNALKVLFSLNNFHNKTTETLKGYKRVVKQNKKLLISTIEEMALIIPKKKVLNLLKISDQKFNRLKNEVYCSASIANLCRKTHPNQLTQKEQNIIDESVNKFENERHTDTSIYYKLLNANILFCCLSTFRKYANALRGKKKYKHKKHPSKTLKGTYPLEYIHFDTTFIDSIEGKKRVVFLKDNYSKALLHYAIVPNGKSASIKDFLIEAFERNKHLTNLLPPSKKNNVTYLVSDGGPENKGEVIKWMSNLYPQIKKVIAYTDGFEHSNNSVESMNNTFKNEFARNHIFNSENELKQKLEEFFQYYNYERYPGELYAYHPHEVLEGAKPDRNRFKDQIAEAKKKRVLINKTTNICGIY